MYNLGGYLGDEFSNVKLTPTIWDRMLESIAAMLFIFIWYFAVYIYRHYSPLETETVNIFGLTGGISVAMILTVWSSYTSPRRIKFPYRLTERNVIVQYRLATRLARVLTVFIGLLGAFKVFQGREFLLGIDTQLYNALEIAMLVMLLLSLVVYYLLAYKYR